MSRPVTWGLCALYLAAIVVANEITATYGPAASIYNAFFLIGLDLTTRDALHDAWGRHRWRNMALLILAGSALSYAVNDGAGRIALASCVAFGAAATADAVVYQAMRRLPWLERANASNVVSSAVDSLIFPTIAFGGLLWGITFAQFSAKIAGGFIWALLLAHTLKRRRAATA
jgi:uncharacterized PurR-regulated membrane protein YhhQ (DUF165 family)